MAKMIVTYIVQIGIQTIEGRALEEFLLTGTQEQVEKELRELESGLTKEMILQVADPKALALLRVRLQIVKQLLNHDMNQVPIYPKVGDGNFRMKDANEPIQFTIMLKVTRRPIEDEPIKLIIP